MAAAFLATDAHAQSSPASPAVNDGERRGSNETPDIIVTATRRETSLQKTAAAISVVTGSEQQMTGRQGLEDLKVSVPNVNFAATSNTSQLYIRGIGNTFISAGGDPGVALYQDSAYLSDQTTTNVNFFDIERVEVLRGPQGGLYGRNATGGAINVLSAKPTSELSGQISVLAGDYGRLESEGYVSGPLGIAHTDVRLSYQVRHLDGFIRNTYQAPASDPQGGNVPDRLDDMDSQAIRLQTLTHLGDGGALRIIFSHYREADNGAAMAVIPTPGFVYPAQALYGLVPSSDPRNISVNQGSNAVRLSNLNASLDLPLAGGMLTLTGNYRYSNQNFVNDCDGTPVTDCTYERATNSKDYFGDIHFASSTAGALRFVVGGTYTNFRQYQLNSVTWDAPSTFVGGTDPTIPFNIATISGGTLRAESWALYADAHLSLSNIWSLVGQARYSHTTKNALEILQIAAFGVNAVNVPTNLADSGVPFKVGFEGQLTPDILVYGNYSTAFKDGAINLGALQATPVHKENVESFEAGLKASFFDRRLQVNAAAFSSRYENLQISQLVGTLIQLTNAPKAQINGAELEITALPASGLRLTASAGYLDPTLKKFSNAPNMPASQPAPPLQVLDGNQLPYVSKWSVAIGANYRFEPVAGYAAEIGGNYNYQSRVYFNEFNTLDNSQKGVGRVDLSASIGPSGDRWKIYGYVRNLTNATVSTGTTIYAALLGAEKAISYAPPRNFGIGFSYKF